MKFLLCALLFSCASAQPQCLAKVQILLERQAAAEEIVKENLDKKPGPSLVLYGASQAYGDVARELERDCRDPGSFFTEE